MDSLMELLYTRRTYRKFEQREIAPDIVEEILTAARISSSSANRQPLRYVVVQGEEKLAKVFDCTRWAGALPPELGVPKEGERPMLYVIVVEDFDLHPSPDTDAGIALANMTLAAWNRGVGSCIVASCTRNVLAEMFEMKESEKIHSVVCFGYPTHKSCIVDMDKDASCNYYLDENLDYLVPKRRLEDIVSYL